MIPVRVDGASRSYFSRLSGSYPKVMFPKIRLTVLPEAHFPMPEAPTAKQRRRKSGEQMRKLMQEMIFASRPRITSYNVCYTKLLRDARNKSVTRRPGAPE